MNTELVTEYYNNILIFEIFGDITNLTEPNNKTYLYADKKKNNR